MFLYLLLSLTLGFLIIIYLLNFSDKLYAKFKNLTSMFMPKKIRCLISFYQNRRRLLSWYTDLLSQSETETIVVHRLGAPRTIVTANPDNVEYILKTKFANFPKGKPFTELLGDFLGLGIFNADGENWSVQRKLASHEFSAKSLREFVVKVLEDVVENRLFPILENAVQNDIVLDMQEVLRRFSFDSICKVSLGLDPFCLDLSKPPPPLAAAFDAASEISASRGAATIPAIWKLKRLFDLGSEKDLKDAVRTVRASVEEMIKSRKNGGERINGGDLLSRFMESGLGDDLIRDMVISFLMAGRDTTSSALTWLFWKLTCHRDVEERLVDEIIAIRKEDDKLAYDDLREMNYAKACLCESMRLYPPVVWDSKHAANHDVLPDGTRVYRGNRVTYFQYGMGRMEKVWGSDRLEFKPDRWLEESGAVKNVSPYKFPVFQAGPRVCLGKEMAFIQMKYVVASVLSRFELDPVRSDQPVFVPLLTAYMGGGFNVRVRRRGG